MKKDLRTESELIETLRRLVQSEGSQEAAARSLKVPGALISYVLNGQRGISETLATAMGFKIVNVRTFQPITEDK